MLAGIYVRFYNDISVLKVYRVGNINLFVSAEFRVLAISGKRYVAFIIVSFINFKVINGFPRYFLSILFISLIILKSYLVSIILSQYNTIVPDEVVKGK